MLFANLALALALLGQQQPATVPDPVDLEDVVVTGRPLDLMISTFIGEVAQPAPYRGLARWRDRLCVGVYNLRPDVAQALSDQVSRRALEVGLQPDEPGCDPNVMIFATDDGDTFTRQIVSSRRRLFRAGWSGSDAGSNAFGHFLGSDQPVRWWTVSMPVDASTGLRAVRMSGLDYSTDEAQSTAQDYGPKRLVTSVSRMSTQVIDDILRVMVVVDVSRTGELNTQQLGDYISMVTLAQIDPTADTDVYHSILNLFDDPTDVDGLTQWDKAYLTGLYDAQRMLANQASHRGEIAAQVRRAHHDLREAEDKGATAN